VAVRDAGVVVHLAISPFRPGRVDSGGKGRRSRRRRRSSGPHLVYASIVSVEQIPWLYCKRKASTVVML
jgi:hypothetical protein